MKIYISIAIIVSTFFLSGNAYNTFSMEEGADLSLLQAKREKIDQALHKVIQTGQIMSQLRNKNISVSENLRQRFKDELASIISLYQSNPPAHIQMPKDEFHIWLLKDYNNFAECADEAISSLIKSNRIKPEDIPKHDLKLGFDSIAFNILLEMQLFEESEEFYMKLYKSGKIQADIVFADFILNQRNKNRLLEEENKEKHHEEKAFLAKERHNLLQQYESFYRTILGNIQGKESSDIQLSDHDYMWLYILYTPLNTNIGYEQLNVRLGDMKVIFESLLHGSLPTNEPIEELQCYLAQIYYALKDFDKALHHYSKVPYIFLNETDHFNIALIFAHKKRWKEAYQKFSTTGGPTSKLPLQTKDDILLVVEVMLREKFATTKGQTSATKMLEELKAYLPEFEPDLNDLLRNIQNIKAQEKEKRLQKLQQLRLQAMASQQFHDISAQFDSFDIQFQNVWAHCSYLPTEQLSSILNPLDKLAQTIQNKYGLFKSLEKDASKYATNISKIMELAQALRADLEKFFHEKIKINHQISKLRRQYHKESSKKTQEKEDFIDFRPVTFSETVSLKKIICEEHKSKKVQTEEKQKLSKEAQIERQKRREALTKAYEEYQLSLKPENEPVNSQEPCIFQFKNDEIQNFWESCAWEALNFNDHKILEMLKALDLADCMSHLRSLLPPGARLERLEGDRKGQLSLRINDQWRLCFYWITGKGPFKNEIVDYHK